MTSIKLKKSIFAENISLILEKSMSSDLLAHISGVNQSTISRISTGSANPFLKTREKIAKSLNLELNYLENNALTLKDLNGIGFSKSSIDILDWNGNDISKLSSYKLTNYMLPQKVFSILVDKDHANPMMKIGSTLEFQVETPLEEDVIAYLRSDCDIEIAKVIRAKRSIYELEIISNSEKVRTEVSNILGVLKNIYVS